jgi:hypothetical protein
MMTVIAGPPFSSSAVWNWLCTRISSHLYLVRPSLAFAYAMRNHDREHVHRGASEKLEIRKRAAFPNSGVPSAARGASSRIIIAWRTKDINYSLFSCLGRSATAISKHLPFSFPGVSRLGVHRFSFGHHPLLLHSLLRNA